VTVLGLNYHRFVDLMLGQVVVSNMGTTYMLKVKPPDEYPPEKGYYLISILEFIFWDNI